MARTTLGCLVLLVLQPGAVGSTSYPVPDDEFLARQWGIQNTGQEVQGEAGLAGADISALEAWGVHPGASAVRVAIVGTGINPHPEFADHLLPGYATIGDPLDTLDPCSRGTHAAGIIGAARDNGMGIAGLHDLVQIMPVRVFNDCAEVSAISVAAGIQWAVDNGADIIVAAVKLGTGHQRLEDAVEYAVSQNVLVIAPAGDYAASEVSFPARYDGCLAVAATTPHDTVATISNFGQAVDLSAPGQDIWSTWSQATFEYRTSTVSAAAFAAGVAALVMSYAPQASAAEVARILVDSADDLGEPGWDPRFGAGRLNALRALELAPEPAIRFEHTAVLPTTLVPGVATSLTVRIADAAETVVEESVHLFHRIDSGCFVSTASASPYGTECLHSNYLLFRATWLWSTTFPPRGTGKR